jgi:hypothetical protein
MALGVDLSILNQRGTPAFFSDIFANRPAFGFAGRIFISTDTGAIYEDTGTSWTLIADAGAGTTGTLQQVTTNGNTTTQGISITAGGLSANSITNTSLTTGSVAFVGAAGLMTQDNANFFWDDTNNRLGLGTITPSAKLDIHGAGAMAFFNGTGANNGYIGFQNAGATKWTIGNQYTGVVNNFQIINRLGNSVFSITGDQQANFEYNVTIKQALNLNNVGDQLRISSGAIDGSIHTNSGDNNMFIGATSTGYGANIDLSTGSIALTSSVTATRFILSGATSPSGLYYTSNRVTVANYTSAGTVEIEVNGGNSAATFNADLSTTFKGAISAAGAISGTSGSFSNNVTVSSASTNGFIVNSTNSASFRGFTIQANGTTQGGIELLPNTGEIRIGGYSTTSDYFPVIYSDGVAALTFGIGVSPSATFVGNVLIGTTTDSGQKLQVNGTIKAANLTLSGSNSTVTTDASFSSFQSVISPSVLTAGICYLIKLTYNSGSAPYYCYTSFLFTPTATNGGSNDNEFLPPCCTHQGNTGTISICGYASSSPSTSGLKVKFNGFSSLSGSLTIYIIQIG